MENKIKDIETFCPVSIKEWRNWLIIHHELKSWVRLDRQYKKSLLTGKSLCRFSVKGNRVVDAAETRQNRIFELVKFSSENVLLKRFLYEGAKIN